MKRLIRTVRQILDLALVLLVVAVLGIVLAANLGPGQGHQLIVIRGASMTPSLPLGSLADVVRVNPAELRPGDIVSVKAPNGVVVTHRVNRVVQLPDGLYIETKGDANAKPDVPLRPASSIMGRVAFQAPYLGYLMFMLTIPSGIASIFCLAITLLLAVWLLEDLEEEEAEEEAAEAEPAPSPEAAAETFPSWADEPRIEQERRGTRLRRTMTAPLRSLARARSRTEGTPTPAPAETLEAAE